MLFRQRLHMKERRPDSKASQCKDAIREPERNTLPKQQRDCFMAENHLHSSKMQFYCAKYNGRSPKKDATFVVVYVAWSKSFHAAVSNC